jgi:formylglycine-generating enzyme required for sulfatase activity
MALIPGGDFQMGKPGEGDGDNVPVHTVHVDSFYLDAREVTNAEYHAFCQATERKLPFFWGMEKFRSGLEFADHPVVGVSWSDAKAYAEWVGKRLPTEAEWEYAGRGGLVGQLFPFGADLDTTQANYRSDGTKPVGSYPPSGYGLYDMAGNVREWVSDYYGEGYYAVSPPANPTGPDAGKFRVIRGGGWFSGKTCSRIDYRWALLASWIDFNVGFRCARDLRPPEPVETAE